jgi:Holliday junction DNA helicase RuvA
MIIGIGGKVLKKEPTTVDIKTESGLTYRVHISLYTSSKIDTTEVSLHTTFIVKEDYQKLFGFYDLEEKEIFDRVLKINGVGPSTALAICSTLTPAEFIKAINSSDINAFKKVPGIGPKSAKRILVEIGEFTPSSESKSVEDVANNKAYLALESLGFKKEAIKKALKVCKSSTTEELIKEALKILR